MTLFFKDPYAFGKGHVKPANENIGNEVQDGNCEKIIGDPCDSERNKRNASHTIDVG